MRQITLALALLASHSASAGGIDLSASFLNWDKEKRLAHKFRQFDGKATWKVKSHQKVTFKYNERKVGLSWRVSWK